MVASVCLCVCLHSAGSRVGPTYLKFGSCIKDHHISDGFEGQGHRSKVKVTKDKNVKIPVFSLVSRSKVKVTKVKVKVTMVKALGRLAGGAKRRRFHYFNMILT